MGQVRMGAINVEGDMEVGSRLKIILSSELPAGHPGGGRDRASVKQTAQQPSCAEPGDSHPPWGATQQQETSRRFKGLGQARQCLQHRVPGIKAAQTAALMGPGATGKVSSK